MADVVVKQLCTGCANTRLTQVDEREAHRLLNLPIPEREKHADCQQPDARIRREWVAVGTSRKPDPESS